MVAENSFLIDIKPSFSNLWFLVTIHLFALLSALLIDVSGVAGLIIKMILLLCIAFSLRQRMAAHNNQQRLHFRSDNQVDLNIDGNDYPGLELSSDCYVSRFFNQLILFDEGSRARHYVTVFPDSIDAKDASKLKARLKLMSKQ